MSPNEGRAAQPGFAPMEADSLLGDFSALLETMGIRGILPESELSVLPATPRLISLDTVRIFLETYLTEILLPVELPAIAAACGHVQRGETRELVALDAALLVEPRLQNVAYASRHIGASQLRRLRPLRGERTVQRYLSAVEMGNARGWHTLVYGLSLAVFAFPLRQGLLHYGRQTLNGLARAAASSNVIGDPGFQELLQNLFSRLPEAVEKQFANSEPLTCHPS